MQLSGCQNVRGLNFDINPSVIMIIFFNVVVIVIFNYMYFWEFGYVVWNIFWNIVITLSDVFISADKYCIFINTSETVRREVICM